MYRKIAICLFLISLNSCIKSKKMKPQNNNIICVVTITSKSMNAYGTIYNCQVIEVLEGTLDSRW